MTLWAMKEKIIRGLNKEVKAPRTTNDLMRVLTNTLTLREIQFLVFLQNEDGTDVVTGWLSETLQASGWYDRTIN